MGRRRRPLVSPVDGGAFVFSRVKTVRVALGLLLATALFAGCSGNAEPRASKPTPSTTSAGQPPELIELSVTLWVQDTGRMWIVSSCWGVSQRHYDEADPLPCQLTGQRVVADFGLDLASGVLGSAQITAVVGEFVEHGEVGRLRHGVLLGYWKSGHVFRAVGAYNTLSLDYD